MEGQLGGGPIESSHSGRRAAPGELGRELRTHSSLRSRIAAEGRWEQEELEQCRVIAVRGRMRGIGCWDLFASLSISLADGQP